VAVAGQSSFLSGPETFLVFIKLLKAGPCVLLCATENIILSSPKRGHVGFSTAHRPDPNQAAQKMLNFHIPLRLLLAIAIFSEHKTRLINYVA